MKCENGKVCRRYALGKMGEGRAGRSKHGFVELSGYPDTTPMRERLPTEPNYSTFEKPMKIRGLADIDVKCETSNVRQLI